MASAIRARKQCAGRSRAHRGGFYSAVAISSIYSRSTSKAAPRGIWVTEAIFGDRQGIQCRDIGCRLLTPNMNVNFLIFSHNTRPFCWLGLFGFR